MNGAIVRNNIKEKLARDEVVSSMTVRLSRGVEIARIAKTAGFDSIYVDMEHSSISLDATAQICLAALEMDLAALVRVPANQPEWISRVLDAGAMGIIAPHVSTAGQAREIVKHARFAPLGERSVVSNLPQFAYRHVPAVQACAALNDATLVMLQFESVAAIEAAEEIVAVDGVDMVMIGANDLSSDMGIAGDYGHPRLHAAFEHTIQVCRQHNKHLGIGGLASRPDLIARFVGMGARYVSCGTDLAFLLAACTARAREVSELSSRSQDGAS